MNGAVLALGHRRKRHREERTVLVDRHQACHHRVPDRLGFCVVEGGQLVRVAEDVHVAHLAPHLVAVEDGQERLRFEERTRPRRYRRRRRDRPVLESLDASVPEEALGEAPIEGRQGVAWQRRPALPGQARPGGALSLPERELIARVMLRHVTGRARDVAIAAQLFVEEEQLSELEDPVVSAVAPRRRVDTGELDPLTQVTPAVTTGEGEGSEQASESASQGEPHISV